MTIRDRIVNAAAELFAQAGYRGATTRRIAEAACVNEVTIFRHFGSKQELIREAIRSARLPLRDMLPEEPADPRAELTAWARSQLEGMRHARAMIRTCMSESEEHPEITRFATRRPAKVRMQLLVYLRALQEQGLARADANVDVAATALMGSLFIDATGRDLMPDMFGYEVEEAPGLCVDLILRALGVDAAEREAIANGGTIE